MEWGRRRTEVRLGADTVEVLDGRHLLAVHDRLTGRGGESLVLDHYMEVLAVKPGALPGATAPARGRACGTFSADLEASWTMARRRLCDQAGTRAVVEVLLAHRSALIKTPRTMPSTTASDSIVMIDPW